MNVNIFHTDTESYKNGWSPNSIEENSGSFCYNKNTSSDFLEHDGEKSSISFTN